MAVTARISPSPEARALFSQMVARADDDELHLNLDDTLALAVERKRDGYQDGGNIIELLQEEWIDRAPDGGWLLH